MSRQYDRKDDYYTGEPCNRGHLSVRRRWGHCRECIKEDAHKYRPKPSYKFERWPKPVMDRLREMARTMTGAEIAKALGPGYTRNSVLGKCHREGIKLGGASPVRMAEIDPRGTTFDPND